ncbi:MAG TPA: transcriptional repressor [Dissulfurispiraceae bacterium]|nr:transcriptional repressor [Dissulfurispiraceae bacterium]
MSNDQFKRFISERGLKDTRERREIFDEVLSAEGHFDPDELFLRLRSHGSKVSRASVYRTIPLLIDSGVIEEVERVDKHAHYERIIGRQHHDHMICSRCGAVFEFYSETLERLQDELCRSHRFEKMRHHLEIVGICERCSTTGSA